MSSIMIQRCAVGVSFHIHCNGTTQQHMCTEEAFRGLCLHDSPDFSIVLVAYKVHLVTLSASTGLHNFLQESGW